MTITRVADLSDLRRVRTQEKLQAAALTGEVGLSSAEIRANLAFYNQALENIGAVRSSGKERSQLLDLLPGTGDYAQVEAATDLQPGDSRELVETRNDYRDAFVEARRQVARAERGKGEAGVVSLPGGAVVNTPRELLVQQGTSVFRGLEGLRGEQFRLENGQPVRESSLLTLAGPMPASFLSRGAVNYGALAQLAFDGLKISTLSEPVAPGDVVGGLNGGRPWGERDRLKADDFPERATYMDGGLYKRDADQSAAPNYRQMPGYPVHGVGQPSRQGFHDMFRHLRQPGCEKTPVLWINTRAEAVLFIDGQPYNLRELSSRLNLPYKEGASGEELERLEEQLKQLLIERGSVPTQREVMQTGPNGKPQRVTLDVEVPVNAQNLRTTREEMQAAADAEGIELDYRRVPVRDESAPSPAELDNLRRSVEEFHSSHPGQDAQYVVNCHMGRGRTTTGMVAVAMTLDALEGRRGGAAPGEARTQELERNANQLVDLFKNIVENDDEVRQKRADLAAAENRSPRNEEAIREARLALEERERRAQEYRDRQLELEMYSLYLSARPDKSFEQWLSEAPQQATLAARRQQLEAQIQEIESQMAALTPEQKAVYKETMKQRMLAMA